MAQYQSFPDIAGDSRTVEKLKALKLPDLNGCSFLDVGCNEGFFCGYAQFQGAHRVVGVDHSKGFIQRAKARFPECEFRAQSWDNLPEEEFDVILLASALHYAEDQPELIRRLVKHLSPDGVLVLELGVVASKDSQWVKVQRGIDERYFPTMRKLQEVLTNYAWKWMGPSVKQEGDPVARQVMHVSRRRPVAYLLMQPPAYGKTSIASKLFQRAGVKLVSGDKQISRIAQGSLEVADELRKIVAEDYSPFSIDQTIQKIFEQGKADELARAWMMDAEPGGDFALDAYVPVEHHAAVENSLRIQGYMPVTLRWEKVGLAPLPEGEQSSRVAAFCESLPAEAVRSRHGARSAPSIKGFVDDLRLDERGQLLIRGWAVGPEGKLPDAFDVRIEGIPVAYDALEIQERPDVRQRMDIEHGNVGFRITIKQPNIVAGEAERKIEVYVSRGLKLRLTKRASHQMYALAQ